LNESDFFMADIIKYIVWNHCACSAVAMLNPLNAELNPICCLLALLGAHHFLPVSRIRVKYINP